MKIIDNKKDYYDYLSGVYGIDELIVFDRRGSKLLNAPGVLQSGLEECFATTILPDDIPWKPNKYGSLKVFAIGVKWKKRKKRSIT